MADRSIIEIIPTMRASELIRLWQNAVKYEAEGKGSKLYGRAKETIAAIRIEWAKRGTRPPDPKDYFDWPSTDAPGGDGRLCGKDWESEGVLKYMGYSVGTTAGLNAQIRRRVLTHVFEGPLPPVFRPGYLNEWSHPSSKLRLQKLAETIAAFTRNAKRRRGDARLNAAIRDWETDLRFLFDEFYVDRFNFEWPSTSVG